MYTQVIKLFHKLIALLQTYCYTKSLDNFDPGSNAMNNIRDLIGETTYTKLTKIDGMKINNIHLDTNLKTFVGIISSAADCTTIKEYHKVGYRLIVDDLLTKGYVSIKKLETLNGFPTIIKAKGEPTTQPKMTDTYIPDDILDGSDEDSMVANKFLNLKASATRRGKEFNLRIADVRNLLRRKRCYYTNVPFDTTVNLRSIDRIDCTKGYVKGNVVACTVRINHLKSIFEHNNNVSKEEIKKFLTKMLETM